MSMNYKLAFWLERRLMQFWTLKRKKTASIYKRYDRTQVEYSWAASRNWASKFSRKEKIRNCGLRGRFTNLLRSLTLKVFGRKSNHYGPKESSNCIERKHGRNHLVQCAAKKLVLLRANQMLVIPQNTRIWHARKIDLQNRQTWSKCHEVNTECQ